MENILIAIIVVLITSVLVLLKKYLDLKTQISDFEERALRAQERVDAKSNFLATMSHEIRTPLNGILVAGRLLKDKSIDRESEELIHIINSSGDLLKGVVNDILDFSKIESGKLELDYSTFNLVALINEVTFSFKKQFEDKDIFLKTNYGEKIPEFLYSDDIRLRQILFNLISNALKFTERGGVTISIDYKDSHLGLTVSDTGKGISPDRINSLFEEYSQETKETYRKFGGTGLGLAISKKLCELLKGDISVSSVEGEGTTFTICVPVQEVQPPKLVSTDQDEVDYSCLQVLVVDDNAINRKVASLTLKKHGIVADEACDGLVAVSKVLESDYDIVYMDIHMPNMNGLEASEELIEKVPYSKLPLIYALSANAFKENKDACFNAGMIGFISKPITFERIEESLDIALSKKSVA